MHVPREHIYHYPGICVSLHNHVLHEDSEGGIQRLGGPGGLESAVQGRDGEPQGSRSSGFSSSKRGGV